MQISHFPPSVVTVTKLVIPICLFVSNLLLEMCYFLDFEHYIMNTMIAVGKMGCELVFKHWD